MARTARLGTGGVVQLRLDRQRRPAQRRHGASRAPTPGRGRLDRDDARRWEFVVRSIVPGSSIVAQAPDATTWCLQLVDHADGTCRLLSRFRAARGRRGVAARIWALLADPGTFVMERRMLLGIRDRAGPVHRTATEARSSTLPRRATPATAVLDHVGPSGDLIVPAGQRRAGRRCSTPSRPTPTSSTACASTRCTPSTTGPYLHGAFGDRLRHVSYFLSHVTRPCFRGRARSTSSRTTSARCATILRDATRRPARARRGVAARPPRLLQPRRQRRLRRRRSSAGPGSSSRPTRRCRARSGATRSTSARSSAGCEVDQPLVEVAAGRRRRRSTTASPRSSPSGSPTARRIQTGIGVDPQRHPGRARRTTATSACTPSCSPTA